MTYVTVYLICSWQRCKEGTQVLGIEEAGQRNLGRIVD